MKKILVLALGFALAACASAPAAAKNPTANPGPTTKIDSPADGAVFPAGDVIIQAHADDLLGVTHGEFSVNDQVLAILDSSQPAPPSAVFTWTWRPNEPGEYHIGVRAQDTTGLWSNSVSIRVVINSPTATATQVVPTIAPTNTPLSAAITVTPTITPTSVVPTASINVAAAGTTASDSEFGTAFAPSFTAIRFYPAGSNCYPNDSGMWVRVSNMTNVANVFAYFAMTDTGVYHFPAHHWTTGMWMWQSAPGSHYFWRKITSKTIIDEVPYYPNYVLYQFVATNSWGTILARSPVYRDMSIVQCLK